MDNKETLNSSNPFEQLTSAQIWEKQYGKELNCKKNIIEYMDIVTRLKKEHLTLEQVNDTYSFIYKHIEGLKDIKPNTMLFLKNNLKSQLGKNVKEKDPKQLNHFIKFFKEAYPENYRRTDFTWVLADINIISDEQIWTTLVYINRECLNNELKLNAEQKKDIIAVIKIGVSKNNIKFINKIRSLKNLSEELSITIVNVGGVYKVTNK